MRPWRPHVARWHVGLIVVLLLASAVAAAGVLWAQTPPPSDIRGSMLIDMIDTLERDLGELSSKRRDVARIKEQLDKRIQWVGRRVGKLDTRVTSVRKQISAIVRSLVHMKEPDDLLLFFSTGRYHDLFVYRRLVRRIGVTLMQHLQTTVRESSHDRHKLVTMQAEMETLNKQQAGIDQELYEIEGLIAAKKTELSERQAKIAAIETLFMTQASRTPAVAPPVIPVTLEAGNGAFADAKGRRSMQIPISPGRVIKAYDRQAVSPYGNQKMDRGWVLVPLVKESKKKVPPPESAYVRAPAVGRVVFHGDVPGFGLTLVLEHQKKYHTVYSNLHRVVVKKGDVVKEGQAIAAIKSADPGKTFPYLYFELREDRLPVDPREWFRLRALADTEKGK